MRSVALVKDQHGAKWRVRVGVHRPGFADRIDIGVNPAGGSGIAISIPREAVPMLIELLKQYDDSMV